MAMHYRKMIRFFVYNYVLNRCITGSFKIWNQVIGIVIFNVQSLQQSGNGKHATGSVETGKTVEANPGKHRVTEYKCASRYIKKNLVLFSF